MTNAANDDSKPVPANQDALPKQGSSDARVVVVTGASRGLGYAVAKAFGASGAHVVAIARTVGGLEDLDDEIKKAGGQTTLVPLDLADHDAIDRLGLALYERFGRVDVLIGNAGVLGTITPLSHMKPKEFEKMLSLNITANYRLIRSMDPLLRASSAGRAVFMTSGMAKQTKPFWAGYTLSKAALEAMVRVYAAEVASQGVCVNLLNPGPVRTALRARAVPGENPDTLPEPDSVVEPVMRLTSEDFTQTGMILNVPTDTLVSADPAA